MRLAALAALAVIGLGGASQAPPTKGEPENAGDAQQSGAPVAAGGRRENATDTASGAQQRSNSLSAYERESLAVDRAANRIGERANSIADAQRIYGFFQLIAAAFTVLFAGAAAYYARFAAIWTEKAASIAGSALDSLERPFLVIEIVDSGIENLEDGSERYSPTRYHLANYGRTPAILTRRHFTIIWGQPAPIDPIATVGRKVAFGIVIGAQGKSPEYKTDTALPLIAGLQQAAGGRLRKGMNPHLIGFVQYRDLIGNVYVTGFCLEHERGEFDLTSWVIEGEDDPYNYDRKLT